MANITLNLTGVARAAALGSLGTNRTLTLAGNSRTLSQGNLSAVFMGNKTVNISGVSKASYVYNLTVGDSGDGFKNSALVFPELQNLQQNTAWIELFTIDSTGFGGIVYRFCNHLNSLGEPVMFGGVTYNPLPIQATGYDYNQTGTSAKPLLSVGNLTKVLLSAVVSQGDLVGAKVSRIRTFAKFLSDGATPNNTAFIGPDVMYIEQKTFHDRSMIQFQLTSVMDRMGMKLPRRQVLKDPNHLGCNFPGVARTRVS